MSSIIKYIIIQGWAKVGLQLSVWKIIHTIIHNNIRINCVSHTAVNLLLPSLYYIPLRKKRIQLNLNYSPGWSGSVNSVLACRLKGRWFNSQYGTCLGCRPGPQKGVHERQLHIDVSVPLFLSLSLKLNI